MIALDYINCTGHRNVLAKHQTTLEITKENYLTPRGDCIVCINSNKGAKDLSDNVKSILKTEGYGYLVLLKDGLMDVISGRGSQNLTFTSEVKMIVRKSDFISDATILIKANKSAKDLRRDLVLRLKEGIALALIIASEKPLHDEEILRVIIDSLPASVKLPEFINYSLK